MITFALVVLLPLLQAADPEELVSKLASPDFEEQGRSAKALEMLGPEALPALKKAAAGDKDDVRAWAETIQARIKESGKKMRALIEKLGSTDDETKEAAARELTAAGPPAFPHLKEAAKSENKNLRGRAAGLLVEMGAPRMQDARPSGAFRCRLAEKKDNLKRGGGDAKTEDAVLAALQWLARHQDPDGYWKVQRPSADPCSPSPGHDDFDAGVTGLSLLAFLGAGYSHLSQETHGGIRFGDVVKKGIQWMMQNQDAEGCIGTRRAQKYMYNHILCALAMAEAHGLTGSALFKKEAQKAVDFIVAAQNPGKGWRYAPKCGDNDSSVTGWAVMALKSAGMSGLAFPPEACRGAFAWFDEATEDENARVGYTHKGTGKVFIPGLNEKFDHHEALTAIAMTARLCMGKWMPRLSKGCDLLLRDRPKWDGNAIDFYYWYCATLALFQYDGPSGPKWKSWNDDMKAVLVQNQNPTSSGCKGGSWEPVDRWSGEGGRVYATAINALTLETYYRHPKAPGDR